MNQQDIDWFKAALSDLSDTCADVIAEVEKREDAADPEGRGGLGYGWAGTYFRSAVEYTNRALKQARLLKPITQEELDAT